METVELDGEDWVTVPDAAELGNVKAVTIYQNISRGRLVGRPYMRRIVVPVEGVLALWPQSEPEPVV